MVLERNNKNNVTATSGLAKSNGPPVVLEKKSVDIPSSPASIATTTAVAANKEPETTTPTVASAATSSYQLVGDDLENVKRQGILPSSVVSMMSATAASDDDDELEIRTKKKAAVSVMVESKDEPMSMAEKGEKVTAVVESSPSSTGLASKQKVTTKAVDSSTSGTSTVLSAAVAVTTTKVASTIPITNKQGEETLSATTVAAVSVADERTVPVSPNQTQISKATNFYRKSPLLWNVFTLTAILYSAVARVLFGILRPLPLLRRLVPRIRAPTMTALSGDGGRSTAKVAIVTGASTGIGFETSDELVRRGYEVVVAVRSEEKARDTLQRLNHPCSASDKGTASTASTGNAVFVAPLDLSSLQSVREFAAAVKNRYEKIDLLVNNAGRNTNGYPVNGLDLCFLTNFVGHFWLTNELLPRLLAADQPRVVNLSSVMHHFCKADRHDETYWKRFALFDASRNEKSYSPSKLAMLYFTIALNKRFKAKGLRSIAVNPGAVNSDIWRGKPRWMVPLFRLLYLTNRQGCQTSVAACVEDLPDDVLYLQPYWQRSSKLTPWPPTEMLGPFVGFQHVPPRLPSDGGELFADALWRFSEGLANGEESPEIADNSVREMAKA